VHGQLVLAGLDPVDKSVLGMFLGVAEVGAVPERQVTVLVDVYVLVTPHHGGGTGPVGDAIARDRLAVELDPQRLGEIAGHAACVHTPLKEQVRRLTLGDGVHVETDGPALADGDGSRGEDGNRPGGHLPLAVAVAQHTRCQAAAGILPGTRLDGHQRLLFSGNVVAIAEGHLEVEIPPLLGNLDPQKRQGHQGLHDVAVFRFAGGRLAAWAGHVLRDVEKNLRWNDRLALAFVLQIARADDQVELAPAEGRAVRVRPGREVEPEVDVVAVIDVYAGVRLHVPIVVDPGGKQQARPPPGQTDRAAEVLPAGPVAPSPGSLFCPL